MSDFQKALKPNDLQMWPLFALFIGCCSNHTNVCVASHLLYICETYNDVSVWWVSFSMGIKKPCSETNKQTSIYNMSHAALFFNKKSNVLKWIDWLFGSLAVCCPFSIIVIEELKGQMALRTVTAMTVVGVGLDWTDGCFNGAYVPLKCQFWCKLYLSVMAGSASILL